MSNAPSVSADALDPVERLALVYTSRQARQAWESLFLLRHRLEEAARPGRDALMIQLRLSWWRDRLTEPVAVWPKGEPLLALLTVWKAETAALVGLVNGWEAKVVGEDGGAALAAAQVATFEALARLVGENDVKPVRVTAEQLTGLAHETRSLPKLTRKMRPLTLLLAHAQRSAKAQSSGPLADFGALLRIGLLGR